MKYNTNITNIKKIKKENNIKDTTLSSLTGIINNNQNHFNSNKLEKLFKENNKLVKDIIIRDIKHNLGNVVLEDEDDYEELSDIISKKVLKKLQKEDRIRDKKSLEKYVEKITKEHTDSVKSAIKDEIKVLGYDRSEQKWVDRIKNLIAGKGNEARGYVELKKLKEERESKKKNMSNVFMKTLGRTKIGKKVRATNLFVKKKIKDTSKFVGGNVQKINRGVDKSESLLFSKIINAVETIGGIDEKDKVKYNLNSHKKTSKIIQNLKTSSNTNSENSFKDKKQSNINDISKKTNIKDEKQSNISTLDNNIGDDITKTKKSLLATIEKNHKSIIQRLEKIDNTLYDVIHKQDTSITKRNLSKKDQSLCSMINNTLRTENENTDESNLNFDFDNKRNKPKRRLKRIKNKFKKGLKTRKLSKFFSKGMGASKAISGVISSSKGLTKFLGPAAIAAEVGLGAYDMYNATNDKEMKRAAGSTIGSIAGGALGSLLGPLGTMAGAYIGSKVGGWATNAFFSDVDDNIPYKIKENPFTFKKALEIKREALINQANNSTDEDFINDANKKIKEIDERIKEVISNSNLKDWLEDAIKIKKKQPQSKGKSQDNVAKSIILTTPEEYHDKLVKIYNNNIVGGLFTKNGNLTLDKNKTKEVTNKKTSGILDKIGKVTQNAIAFSPILTGIKFIKDTLFNEKNKDNNIKKENKLINVSNNSNINKLSTRPLSIKIPDKTNNVELNNRTKELINEIKTEVKGKETVKEIIKEVPITIQNEEAPATVSLNNFSDHSMDVIVSEIIGGQ